MINKDELRVGNWVIDETDEAYQIEDERDFERADQFECIRLSILALEGLKQLPIDTSNILYLHQYHNLHFDITRDELDLSKRFCPHSIP